MSSTIRHLPAAQGRTERFIDPRYFQMAVLSTLLSYGIFWLDFGQSLFNVVLIVSSGLVFQWIAARMVGVRFDPRSTIITSCSLSLLLRAAHPALLIAASAIAVGGKFLLRVRGKHLFNPANLAIAVLTATTEHCWLCPGQWGSNSSVAILLVCSGIMVVSRAHRSDIALSFLLFWSTALLARALYLHDPLSIPLHQLSSGSLLVFSFFMISDPKSTPDSFLGRIVFALLVASTAYFLRFKQFEPNALIYSLICCSMLTPFIDRILPGEPYGSWTTIRKKI